MKKFSALLLIAMVFCLFADKTMATEPVNVKDSGKITNFGLQTEYFIDALCAFDHYAQIADSCFKPNLSTLPNFNTTNARVWLRFKLINTYNEKRFLNINQPSLDLVSFQFEGGESTLGDHVRVEDRPVQNQNYIFELPMTTEQGQYVYLRINSGDAIILPLQIGLQETITSSLNLRDNLFSIFFGIMITLLLYNLFIFLKVRERIYGYYIAYITMILLAQANLHGYTSRCIWPDNVILEHYAVFLLIPLAGTFGLLFISNYVELYKHKPKANKILFFSIFAYFVGIVLGLAGMHNIAYNIIQINGTINSIVILYSCARLWSMGNRHAGFVLTAWSIFFVGVIAFILKDVGVLPYNTFTVYTMTFGSAIEGILLSFGLADKINVLKREKEEAQVRELGALKMSEVRLEAEVRERTHELYEAKEKIELQFQDLQKSQRQLVESEKMAGLGQMTAGIAHELNNPINFVSSNVAPLEKDIEEILEILTDFKNLPHEPTSPEIEAVRAKFRDYDVPMLETEIKTLLAGIREGSTRASDIVSGLRIFARTDQDVFVDANVNDCVDATLVLIKSTYKNEVNLTRQTDSALPNIDCLPGKLNQVLVNLIGNAVQATIESHTIRQDRKVDVRTWHDEEYIHLSVSDNGPGIPEELQSKIFEPFFTTKKVGQGTGLGLSISKSIIEDHQGTLEVESSLGQGCTFIITLPRKRAMRQQAA
jgi:two-component system, NtrC family, sensor kinase